MARHQLFEIRKSLINLCQDLSGFIKGEMSKIADGDIEEKDMNSLVSYVDTEAERRIVERLKVLTPDAGFITEENTVDQETKREMWIIDPLDGTKNYLHKIPHFSTSIAFSVDNEIILGVVYEIMLDRAFSAIKGFGAWQDEEQINVSQTLHSDQAIVVTGFPYKRSLDIDQSIELLKHCVLNYRGVRRLGSAALDLAYVASGKIDIYYEKTLNIWDLAAGTLIVEEAGGKVTDYKGTEDYLKNGMIVASNGHLHENIQQAIQNHLF